MEHVSSSIILQPDRETGEYGCWLDGVFFYKGVRYLYTEMMYFSVGSKKNVNNAVQSHATDINRGPFL